ncbi:hypothetical protein CHUAL_010942 [Chamberlinius hualienensis]
MAADNIGSLENEALKRRQKLQSLKARKGGGETGTDDTSNQVSGTTKEGQLPKPVFRNYKPHDESLKEHTIPRPQLSNLEEKVKDELEAAKTKPVVEGLDLSNLAPRKPDWDLKRDVSKKLEMLERQTQRSIAELIRARLKSEDANADLAALVNMEVKANDNDLNDDTNT